MKDKNLWVVFLSLGTMFFMISTTIEVTWLKLLIISISVLQYILALIFAAKDYSNKKQNNTTGVQSFPPPPPPTFNYEHQTINFIKMKHLERALQGRNGIGRYLLMFVSIFFIAQLAAIPVLFMLIPIIKNGGSFSDITSAIENPTAFGVSANFYLAVMMSTFVLLYFAFSLLIKPIHQRTVRETINGRKHIRWNRIWTGMIVWGIFVIIDTVISLLISGPYNFEFRFNASAFLPMLLIILVLMPFQTSIEEILMRGYLAQGVGKWTRSRWWALIIPSVIFALLHAANPEVKEFGFWLAMPQYLIMGLMLGLVSILDDGIELALGIHFINNALAAMLVTHDASAFQTDALFKLKELNPVASLISISIACVLVVLVLQRIYKWNFNVLNKKLELLPPPVPPMQTEVTEPVQHV